ncbi:alpha/beta hydrolase [Saccharothrix longispora]|uniref:alpha/beta fold hydrolase n=1 Tax=Saccharothrix longispora TaxID=33920 RepID=UPI0028FD1970|nr:alpha/beta hydrolase [Saccharothrix longispora]MBY8850196.1 alpha/beta hydrolase [Saccharothrix sp. MB29]MDU0291232.1 alpha/beta hydrolase [Saccharothrix longispora]
MTTYVLIPGACHGGWYFAPITARLCAEGHEVHALTLGTGRVNLDDHVAEVLDHLAGSALSDVVLVGHSYGGMVITAVADRVPALVGALVYVDAFVPRDGESAYDIVHGDWRRWYVEGSTADGFSMAPLPSFDHRATAHPLATLLQRVSLTGAVEGVADRHYLFMAGFPDSPLRTTYERLVDDPSWRVRALPGGHDVVREAPEEFLEVLRLAGG